MIDKNLITKIETIATHCNTEFDICYDGNNNIWMAESCGAFAQGATPQEAAELVIIKVKNLMTDKVTKAGVTAAAAQELLDALA